MMYDVIVAGAGTSGMTAAIAAARNGAKVLLIERSGTLGGMNTAGLVGPLMTFHSGDQQIVRGLAEEIVQRMIEQGGCLGHIADPLGVVSTITPFEPEILKQVYYQMVAEEPLLTLKLNTLVVEVDRSKRHVQRLVCMGKSGKQVYEAKLFIDATGDGDVAYLAHAPFDAGRTSDALAQPMTLMFKLGGVDFDRIRSFMTRNPEQFIMGEPVRMDDYIALSGYFDAVQAAKDQGRLHILRDRILLFQGMHPGEAMVNMTRVVHKQATSTDDITAAMVEAHQQVDEIIAFLRNDVDGFRQSYLMQCGSVIGVRESRRFHCRYMLTVDDVLSGRDFEDGIAACAFPVDIHDPNGGELQWIRTEKDGYYTLPFRVMQLNEVDNMLVTGRCIGASHEALASARVSPTAMAMGEAAGTAAALVIEQNATTYDALDVQNLRKRMVQNHCIIEKHRL